MTIQLQERKFSERLEVTDKLSEYLMKYLVHKGHIESFKKATYEEDMFGAIDFWITKDGLTKPIQFKLRIKQGNSDFPIVRYQPFYGTDCDNTVVGRDYKGLTEGQTTDYYVTAKNSDGSIEIYRASKEKILPVLEHIDSAWKLYDRSRPWNISHDRFTNELNSRMIQQSGGKQKVQMIFGPAEDDTVSWQIWWQKNAREKFSKINFYLPSNLKEESWTIPNKVYRKMESMAMI